MVFMTGVGFLCVERLSFTAVLFGQSQTEANCPFQFFNLTVVEISWSFLHCLCGTFLEVNSLVFSFL